MPLKFDNEWLGHVQATMSQLPKEGVRPAKIYDVQTRRANGEIIFPALFGQTPDAEGVTTTTHEITSHDGATITVYQFTPAAAASRSVPGPALLHLHGGWMIVASVRTFERQTALMAALTGLPIFSVDYRLAPEHPHPTPVEDGYAGLKWLHANAERLGVDPARIGVYGESAGGGLTAGVCLLARDRKLEPPVAKQLLVYPMLDHHPAKEDPELKGFTGADIYDDQITGWSALLGRDVSKESVDDIEGLMYASPARAADLSGLPDTYIDVGNLDILRDEAIEYARRLVSEGKVDTELHVYPGVTHGFEAAGFKASVTSAAVENRIRWFKKL